MKNFIEYIVSNNHILASWNYLEKGDYLELIHKREAIKVHIIRKNKERYKLRLFTKGFDWGGYNCSFEKAFKNGFVYNEEESIYTSTLINKRDLHMLFMHISQELVSKYIRSLYFKNW